MSVACVDVVFTIISSCKIIIITYTRACLRETKFTKKAERTRTEKVD